MPRKERIFLPGGVYHVYCRVGRGEPVFDDVAEADSWIQIVANLAWIQDVKVLAWCLMSNHYHLVVRAGNTPLWKTMAVIQGRVAKNFNRRHRYMGRLWQSRYKARIVQEQRYLDYLFAYVHLNPVAAGMVLDPAHYPFSGHTELLGACEPRLCDVETALLNFDVDLKTARSLYQQQVRVVAEARWLSVGVQNLPWWRTVNDNHETMPRDDAPEDSVDYLGRPLPADKHHRPRLEAVLQLFEDAVGLASGDLAGCSRVSLLSWYRCMFATFAVSRLGYPTKETAQVLDKASGSVSRWVSDGLHLQQLNSDFRCALDQLVVRFAHEWPDADVLPIAGESPSRAL